MLSTYTFSQFSTPFFLFFVRNPGKGFGNLESKTLAQVTNHFDWCPEHIQVKGKGVEGIVACADCKPLTRYEELKLGLSRK
jgi:putative DNA primase/helicase